MENSISPGMERLEIEGLLLFSPSVLSIHNLYLFNIPQTPKIGN